MLIVVSLAQVLVIAAARFASLPVLWIVTGAAALGLGFAQWGAEPFSVMRLAGPLLVVLTAFLSFLVDQAHRHEIRFLDERIRTAREVFEKTRISGERVKGMNEVLEQNELEVASLYELTKSMNASLEFSELFEIFSGTLRRAFTFEIAKLILLQPDPPGDIDRIYQIERLEGQRPVIAREEKRRITLIDRELRSHPNIVGAMNFDREIVRELRRGMKPVFVSEGIRRPHKLQLKLPETIRSFIAMPLRFEGQLLGILTMENFTDEVFEKFAILAGQLAIEIKKAKLYETVQELALTDGLTGVFRRRHFLERYREEFERSRKRKLSLAVLMLDLDRFKKYNDEHGHLVGDSALRGVAQITKQNLREVDLLGRLGGEEFCVALPETDKDGARQVAERIRAAIAGHSFKAYDETTHMTVSIGVSAFPADTDQPQALVEHADEALYRAKRAGRNRVALYSSGEREQK